MIKITTVKNRENKGVRDSLIKSYEILEEKFNQNDVKIDELKTELSGGYQEEKKEKKNSAPTVEKFTFL